MKKLIPFLILFAMVACSKSVTTPSNPAPPTQTQIQHAQDSTPVVSVATDTMTVYDARLNVYVFMKIRDSVGHIDITAYANITDFAPCYIITNKYTNGDKILFSSGGTVNHFKYMLSETSVVEIKLD